MKPRRVGLLGFDGVMALDVIGPVDAFSSAMPERKDAVPQTGYEVVIIGLSKRPFASESGVRLHPHASIRNAPALDTLIIPGGSGLRNPVTQAAVAEWLMTRVAKIRRI